MKEAGTISRPLFFATPASEAVNHQGVVSAISGFKQVFG